MQHYLNDGEEVLEISFDQVEVAKYNALFNQSTSSKVPTMLCARLWPKFKTFQNFSTKVLLLHETIIETNQVLYSNESYQAKIMLINEKKIGHFIKYIYKMEIYKYSKKCIDITQTFLEKVK
ncbi:hypothetical protein MHZ36_08385 [Staphylococcus sp. ACRSN]|uniref:hypothetical protein n=1 Tax=Staphylococcus sp. ACRSN TaxID=2918214 RepID=UPI001EF21E47|nr:hypothetical protein [Staphylococcus sp. ACRSN]MCG7339307.1 hypothetical protein [Staphylococcus sp. ACRSN]